MQWRSPDSTIQRSLVKCNTSMHASDAAQLVGARLSFGSAGVAQSPAPVTPAYIFSLDVIYQLLFQRHTSGSTSLPPRPFQSTCPATINDLRIVISLGVLTARIKPYLHSPSDVGALVAEEPSNQSSHLFRLSFAVYLPGILSITASALVCSLVHRRVNDPSASCQKCLRSVWQSNVRRDTIHSDFPVAYAALQPAVNRYSTT